MIKVKSTGPFPGSSILWPQLPHTIMRCKVCNFPGCGRKKLTTHWTKVWMVGKWPRNTYKNLDTYSITSYHQDQGTRWQDPETTGKNLTRLSVGTTVQRETQKPDWTYVDKPPYFYGEGTLDKRELFGMWAQCSDKKGAFTEKSKLQFKSQNMNAFGREACCPVWESNVSVAAHGPQTGQ